MTASRVFKTIFGLLVIYAGVATIQVESGWLGVVEGVPVILFGAAILYLAFGKNPIRRGPQP